MKNWILAIAFLCGVHLSQAQVEGVSTRTSSSEEHGFNKENIFAGGSLSLGYQSGFDGTGRSTNVFNAGVLPEIGYNLSKVFDLGVSGSVNYYSYSFPQYETVKLKTTTYGFGAFVRARVFDQFYLQVMPELNFSRTKETNPSYTYKYNINSSSFLVGAGYRYMNEGARSCFNIAILVDLGKDDYSPYKSYTQNGQVVVVPIYRASYLFFPFRK